MTSKTACASSGVLVDVATGYKKNLLLALEREFECPASSKEEKSPAAARRGGMRTCSL